MCSLTTSGGARTSVDLICVIDVSGSMQGPKI
jgi:Mg-chelatase subunit ChlD